MINNKLEICIICNTEERLPGSISCRACQKRLSPEEYNKKLIENYNKKTVADELVKLLAVDKRITLFSK
jgi:hypothetical protein